ncbi:SseB family protein [Micromonosporaceae bacterium Da 78-11]
MSEWEPATDAEVAMRDALRTDDQESYFRILSGVDLLLPVSADALAGLAPLGWGTWSTGGRTHVLAFTSSAALQACLADYTGSARRVPYAELANTWPNLEWWLAVNPGLPIEGYLPAWFVAQLSRGDLRLPTRGPVRETHGTSKIQDLQAAALAAATGHDDLSGPGGPTHDPTPYGEDARSVSGYGRPPSSEQSLFGPRQPAYGPAGEVGQPSDASAPGSSRPGVTPPPGYGQAPGTPPPGYAQAAARPAGYPQPTSAPPASPPRSPGVQPISAPPAPPAGYLQSSAPEQAPARSAGFDRPPTGPTSFGQPPAADSGRPNDAAPPGAPESRPAPGQVGPGGLPIRNPSGVLPNGLPTRAPSPAVPTSGAGPSGPTPQSYREPADPGTLPGRSASATAGESWPTFEPERDPRGPLQDLSAPLPVRTPMAQTPPVSENFALHNPDEVPFEPRWSGDVPAPASPADLPRRQTPAAREVAPGGFPQGPASPQAAAAQRINSELQARPDQRESQDARRDQDQRPAAEPSPLAAGQGFGSPLPRRQATSPSEQPVMTSFPAFQTPAGRGTDRPADPGRSAASSPAPIDAGLASQENPALAREAPGIIPPVVPGTPGNDRPARFGSPQPLESRRGAPVPPAPAVPDEPRPLPASAHLEATFVPANDVERELFEAADAKNHDVFLSTLLLSTVLVPVANHSRPGSTPGESGFAFRTEQMEGEQFLVVFTSKDRLSEHFDEPTRTAGVRFLDLIRNWPDPAWSFAVNPDGPVGAKYPGPQVIALASWAAESGLGAEPLDSPPVDDASAPVPVPEPASDDAQHATVMQKTLPPDQVDYYLDRGYDRVAGFVHRATEVEHLRTPGELFGALGLSYDSSPHLHDAKEAFVLRWPAYRPSLYRIPYGGQNEQALRAMDGWVIERAPFRGNGFAPGEGRDVVAEFKVDSVRLPHGSQLWRIDADGNERMFAIFDNDGPLWRRVGEQ